MTDYSNVEITQNNKNKTVYRLLKYAVFAFLAIFAVYSVIICVLASEDTEFAERYSVTVSAFIREGLAKLTHFLPFSLAETIVVAGIPLVLFTFIRAAVLRFYYKEKGRMKSYLLKLLCVIMAAFSLFINTFGVCYKRERLSYMLGIETENISDRDLVTTVYLCSMAASGFSEEVSHLPDGSTSMPYGFDEMIRRIHKGYERILKNVPGTVSVKPVTLSKPWTYTYISGMYFPFTGESNVNVNFPDFVMTFSTAHEMAHQFGFASEDEANMMAFLALHYSEDSYLVYSAYMNALDYLIGDMNPSDAALIGSLTDKRVLKELNSYYSFLGDYRNKTVSELSSGINDAYLKANGVENGTKSYSDVSKLICGFMKNVYGEYYEKSNTDVTD